MELFSKESLHNMVFPWGKVRKWPFLKSPQLLILILTFLELLVFRTHVSYKIKTAPWKTLKAGQDYVPRFTSLIVIERLLRFQGSLEEQPLDSPFSQCVSQLIGFSEIFTQVANFCMTDDRDSRKKSYICMHVPFWVPFLLSLVVNSMKPGPYRELRKMFVARFGKNWRNAGEPNGNVFCLLLNQWSEWATFSLLTLEFLKSQLWS